MDTLVLLNESLSAVAIDHIDSGKHTNYTLTMLEGLDPQAIPFLVSKLSATIMDHLGTYWKNLSFLFELSLFFKGGG